MVLTSLHYVIDAVEAQLIADTGFNFSTPLISVVQTGIPLLYSGDEIAQVNDYSYKDDPKRVEDSHYLHLGQMRWDLPEYANDLSTPEGQLFCGLYS